MLDATAQWRCAKEGCPTDAWCMTPEGIRSRCGEEAGFSCDVCVNTPGSLLDIAGGMEDLVALGLETPLA